MLCNNKILILDFGSQYSQLIVRRIREIGVYCEILPFDIASKVIKQFNPAGIILSGGPESVTNKRSPKAPTIIWQLGCPILGICYGMQTMADQLGGEVVTANQKEFGYAETKLLGQNKLFSGFKKDLQVWMSHGDQVSTLPPGFVALARTVNSKYAAIADIKRNFYGIQFHPEVSHTKGGDKILANFVYKICKCQKNWDVQNIIENGIQNIQSKVGSDKVLLGLSGGVDSAVAAMFLHRAIGRQLICMFIDTGFLRLNEKKQILEKFRQHFGLQIIVVNAQSKFLRAMKGVVDPERKRKIIGRVFIETFTKEAKKIKNVSWLAQGTIYPDVIESAQTGFGKSRVIKSHHNVGGLPKKMPFKLVEPLRELFKDEVRKIGLSLGLPPALVYRHPFPGPGLATRIIGEVIPKYLRILRLADNIFIEELTKHKLYHKVSQAFAVFLPIKSVGVVGDVRRYAYVIALRAVITDDFMTCEWAKLPHDFFAKVSTRIINEIPEVVRVVYDVSSKPPATVEWE